MPRHVYIQICTCHRSGFCNKTKELPALRFSCMRRRVTGPFFLGLLNHRGCRHRIHLKRRQHYTQRDVTSHNLWKCVAPHFCAVASSFFLSAADCVQAVATDCDMNTMACNSLTTPVSWPILRYKMSHYSLLLSSDIYLPGEQTEETVH
jgi:hypothetical protein